ncbi:MAG: outer-membrane lipoprotein carrier protein LolA [Isosphaeraceae bacterium]
MSISRLDRSPAWGDDQYEGRAILMSPNYAWLDFQKVTQDSQKGKKLIPHERIICTGVEVWQYRSDTRQIFIFPLEKQAQQRALEEGPLPFLFNMKAAEAEARYLMSLVNETPEYFVISVVPKLKIDLESFSKAFLKLNKKTFLPDRIFLVSPDGRSTKDFTLTSVRPNAPVATANFKGQVLGKPWTVVRNPDAAGNPNGAPARDASTTPTAPRQQPAAGLGARQPSVAPAAAPRRR